MAVALVAAAAAPCSSSSIRHNHPSSSTITSCMLQEVQGTPESSPHLHHSMDSSDIMSDPGTVPGGGFGLAGLEGASGFNARIKPGRNRFMPHQHLGSGGYYRGCGGQGVPS